MSAPESHPPAPDTLAADGHDLGSLALPVLLFGGPYGNVQATQAIRDEAHRLRIPPARVLCTGDVCAYFAEPEACVQLIRDWGIAVVMGNCEESLGFGMDDCGCGFAEGTACDLLSQAWYAFSAEALSDPSKAWMRTLPRRIRFSANGRTFTALHGAPDAINRFVFASDNALAGFMAEAGTDDVIGGHSGLPFTRRIGNRLWHNPGAIGMPANDGTTDVWYSLLADDGAAACGLCTAASPMTTQRRPGACARPGFPLNARVRWKAACGPASTCCRLLSAPAPASRLPKTRLFHKNRNDLNRRGTAPAMNTTPSGIRLTTAWHDGYRDDVVGLLRAYQDELGISLETQGFAAELAAFPGPYGPPDGALVLAIRDADAGGRAGVVGVVALRPLEPGACEMKRLYVATDARGLGLGLELCQRLLAEARRLGYGVMRLDTLERLQAAIGVYRRLGFRPCADYNGNPIPGVQFFELDLHEPSR